MFANQALESPVERGGEACIGDCRAAQRLCAQFEDILRHGLKPGWFGKAPTFWPAVLKISRKQAIQYIKRYWGYTVSHWDVCTYSFHSSARYNLHVTVFFFLLYNLDNTN